MKRISIVLAIVASLAAVGCNKPSEESCRKAIANMRELLGTDVADSNADLAGDVRRCKGGSSKKAVECAMNAKTLDELRACDFMKVPDKTPGDAGSAAAGSAGSAGSAAAGDATGGAGAGSAGATDGSAAVGSAGAGSAGATDGSAAAGSAGAGSAGATDGSAAAGSAGATDGAAAAGSAGAGSAGSAGAATP